MKTFLLFVIALSLVSCGGAGGGYTVTEQSSDCPLCKAAKEGDLDQVEIFLSGGMDPNSVSSSANAFPEQTEIHGILNDSALRFAVVSGHADIVRVLIDAGADVNKANKKDATPLSAASNFSSVEIAKILLDSGANPDATAQDGSTALMNAVLKGYLKIAEVLLDGGANPNTATQEGLTALMVVAESGSLKVAEVLLDGGANPNATDKDGNTVLMYATWNSNAEVAKVLLDRGANPNWAGKDGWTPINIAADQGQAEIAKMLLDCGASPDKRNNNGDNAWYWADQQPVMHAIFNRYLAEVKAGKVIKSCPHD